jgi:hypothetical protein
MFPPLLTLSQPFATSSPIVYLSPTYFPKSHHSSFDSRHPCSYWDTRFSLPQKHLVPSNLPEPQLSEYT